jgi:primosomal protein N' (replication factor Y) (superfamily II helicase)
VTHVGENCSFSCQFLPTSGVTLAIKIQSAASRAWLLLVDGTSKSPNMNNATTKFARVAIPSPLSQSLTYAIPDDFRERIAVGMRVLIPLAKRQVTGVILELLDATPLTHTRPILSLPDDMPVIEPALLLLGQWVAQYYLATLSEVVAAILPPPLRREGERTVLSLGGDIFPCDPVERQILDLLRQNKRGLNVKILTRQISPGDVHQALERLQSRGAVAIHDQIPGRRRKNPVEISKLSPEHPPAESCFTLTPEQQSALTAIDERRRRGGFEVFLLHGVTGSGKTEVYLRAMEQTRLAGRQSLILIPEISLTPQLIDRLGARFPGRVGILHSALTGAERWSQWWRIARGDVDVVIGARSAVFAPLPRLGLIIVDEEHDPSYKQEEGLRYNGRDVAVVRGKLLACPVILGSATPAVESYENGRQGRYRLCEITGRVQSRPMPKIELVDLRAQGKKSGDSDPSAHQLISQELANALRQNYRRARQSLIFLNRRGFANFLQCRLCGHILRCPYCSVTLTLHLQRRSLCCHHCNFRRPVMEVCPECGNSALSGIGSGTEQIEQALGQIVPGARIARMDRDTTSKRGSQEALIRRWERGEIDIMLGTQMITKGHDISGVTLVGALLADMSLNVPDFRAAERTFQLLSQVAGRSGRGEDPGRVIVQTYTPKHYTMRHLLRHDYQAFFAEEIEFRRALNYPPFSRLVSLRIDGPKAQDVEVKAKNLAHDLRAQAARDSRWRQEIEILGPAPAPILKLRNRYRWQLLLKGKQSATLLELAGHARGLLPRSRVNRLHIDVDPYSML